MNVHQFPERIVTPAALEHPYGTIRALDRALQAAA